MYTPVIIGLYILYLMYSRIMNQHSFKKNIGFFYVTIFYYLSILVY